MQQLAAASSKRTIYSLRMKMHTTEKEVNIASDAFMEDANMAASEQIIRDVAAQECIQCG